MQELFGNYNIFDMATEGEAVCVTTNGMIKKDGHAVMGAGIAKEANQRFALSKKLAGYLKKYGNRAFNMGCYEEGTRKFNILTLPTKNDWRDNSDIELICISCQQLVEMCNKFGFTKVYLPRPGCTNGKLDWSLVKSRIETILDDRFIVVSRSK